MDTMDAELIKLAATGATKLVELMTTELWGKAKGRFAALFGKDREAAVAAQLEESKAGLESAGSEGAAEAVGEWKPQLKRLLAADPAAQTELRSLLEEFSSADQPGEGSVHQTISGGVFHDPVIMVGKQIGGSVNVNRREGL